MAEEKLSQQPPATAGTEDDFGLVVQSGVTKRQTRPQLRTAILSAWQTFVRTFLASATTSDARAAIGAVALTDTGAFAGSAARLTSTRTITASGDASGSVGFNGTSDVSLPINLVVTGVAAGTYGSVTVDTKGRVTAATVATPIANGGTGATTQAAGLTALLGASSVPVANGGTGATTSTAAGTNLGTAVVGTNTDQLAKSAMIQAEIANKRTWTAYSSLPVTATTGTYTSASAVGSRMTAFGICYFRIIITITTKGTGVKPIVSGLDTAAAQANLMPIICNEGAVNGKTGRATFATTTSLQISDYNNADIVTADGCVIYIMGSYPVA